MMSMVTNYLLMKINYVLKLMTIAAVTVRMQAKATTSKRNKVSLWFELL